MIARSDLREVPHADPREAIGVAQRDVPVEERRPEHGAGADGRFAPAMRFALKLATRAGGRTSPNPNVGAVALSETGAVLATGFHRAAGEPHAERELLRDAGARGLDLHGSTLVSTLEPCTHSGRTPPCAPAVIGAGFARVVVATRDPNPLVQGGGLRLLQEAGVEVIEGVLEAEARRVIEGFARWITTGVPFVHLKVAMLEDGTVYRGSDAARDISGAESKRVVHRWRHLSPAILVGGETLRTDDPRLTVRELPADERDVEPWQPLRVVLSSRFDVPVTARAFDQVGPGARPAPLVIGALDAPTAPEEALAARGVETARVPSHGRELDLRAALGLLGRRGVTGVLVEAGPKLADALMREGLVDRLSVFVTSQRDRDDGGASPLSSRRWVPPGGLPFTGDGLREREERRIGRDVLITGLVQAG